MTLRAFQALATGLRASLGELVTYTASGAEPVSVRGIVTLAERADPFADAEVRTREASITLRTIDVPSIASDDVFVIRGETFAVDHPFRDGEGMVRCTLRLVAP